VDEALLDELYSAPLGEFVARRTALAKQLKAEGRADEAAEVTGTRKPTVPVSAVNQLARRNKPAVDGLLSASEELRTAIGKGDRERFAEAQQRQGDALRKLRSAARSLLGEPTEPTLERIVSTFRSASVDEDLRGPLAAGRLTEEPEPGGFDALAGLSFAPPRSRAAKDKPKRAADDGRAERVKRATAALREAKAEQRERERSARGAERSAEQARRAADEAAAAVRAAEEALASARRA
jgi:hypothetical protein